MTQLRKIYETLKSRNPNLDDAKARQQAWVIRDRMIFENSAASSSAAAGAAGAGGAGGGGGSGGARKRAAAAAVEILGDESYLIYWIDSDTDTHKFFLFNHSTNTLSTTIDTELIDNSGDDWYLVDIFKVQNKGFSLVFRNYNTDNTKIWYLDFNGEVIDIKDLESFSKISNLETNVLILGETSGTSYIYNFDGEKIITFTLERPSSCIEISDDFYYDDLGDSGSTKGGTIVIRDTQRDIPAGSQILYLGLPDGTLIDKTDILSGIYTFDYNTNFIISYDSEGKKFAKGLLQDSELKVLSEKGTTLNNFIVDGISGFSTLSKSIYGENCVFHLFNDNTTSQMVSYDGDSNQFVSFTFSSLPVSKTYYSKKSMVNPISSFGTTLTQVSIDGSFFQSSSGKGFLGTVNDIWWLPKGQTEFLHHSMFDLGSEVFFQDPNADDSGSQTFTNGVNPVVVYATSSSTMIYVGFLTNTGFVTQSTGVLMSNLASQGVYGGKFGDYTFAGYNQNNENMTWQIYGESSILETFTTSINFTYGEFSETSDMNGTFMVLDTSGDASASYPSYYYTSETGLQELYLQNGDISNVTTEGSKTGLSSEFQMIQQFDNEGYLTGFYLLSKSGLSSLKDLTSLLEGDNHTMNEVTLGEKMITLDIIASSSAVIKQTFDFSNIDAYKTFPPQLGTYLNVESSTDGAGTGLLLNVVVTEGGKENLFNVVATLVDGGFGYAKDDSIFLETSSIGALFGSDNTPGYKLQDNDIVGEYRRIMTFEKSSLNLISNVKKTGQIQLYRFGDRTLIAESDLANTTFTFLTLQGKNQVTVNSDKPILKANDVRDTKK